MLFLFCMRQKGASVGVQPVRMNSRMPLEVRENKKRTKVGLRN